MSHFSVLVIGPDHDKQLQPFHEYECTGIEDEFVKDIDITEEAVAVYAAATETRLKAANGTLHSFFTDAGGWHPKFSQPDPDAQAWDRNRRTYFVPAGYERVEVPTRDLESFAEWVEGYYGSKVRIVDGVEKVFKHTNPDSHWDGWSVGGRWTGFLKLKPGAEGAAGEPGLMTPPAEKGSADQALKGDVDFAGMRDEAGAKASVRWHKAQAVTGGATWESWEHVREVRCKGDIEAARAFYNAQPAIVALKADGTFGWNINDTLRGSREAFVQAARDSACTTWAIVYKGEWTEKGEMGWFGTSSNDKDQAEWNRMFNEFLDGLPDDTLLTIVDCHI